MFVSHNTENCLLGKVDIYWIWIVYVSVSSLGLCYLYMEKKTCKGQIKQSDLIYGKKNWTELDHAFEHTTYCKQNIVLFMMY